MVLTYSQTLWYYFLQEIILIPSLSVFTGFSYLFLIKYSQWRGKKGNLAVKEEKPNRHYPNQGIKVNITSSKNSSSMTFLMQTNERTHHLHAVFPKTYPLSNWRKCQTKPNQRTFYFKTWVLIRMWGHEKQKNWRKCHRLRRLSLNNNTKMWYSIVDPEAFITDSLVWVFYYGYAS